jgi:lipopolysaccharide assembly outer membrane protein LptD (OstA)
MSNNKKKIQITLLLFGFFLIFSTYFFYPKIAKKEILQTKTKIEKSLKIEAEQSNVFESVSYEGFYNVINPFTVQSESAFILEEDLNIVYMKKMNIKIYMNDGSVVDIKSDKGRYNKTTYDCYFVNNVKASDGETILYSDNLDLLASEDLASVYNNVVINDDKSSLKADQINYNFEEKNYKISMYDDKQIKVKIIE